MFFSLHLWGRSSSYYLVTTPMQSTPAPDPDLSAVPGRRLLAGLSLVALAVTFSHLLAVPGLLATLAGFAVVLSLPILASFIVVRVGTALLETERSQTIPRPAPEPDTRRVDPQRAD